MSNDEFKDVAVLDEPVIRDRMKDASFRLGLLEQKRRQVAELEAEIDRIELELQWDCDTIRKAMQDADVPKLVVGDLMAERGYAKFGGFFTKVHVIPSEVG